MVQTLDLSSARPQAGAVRGGVAREVLGKLDFSRIAAESGAIAVHVAALMLLLAPMSVPPAPVAEEVISDFEIIRPKDPPPPPPPPVEVPIRTSPRTPPQAVQPARVEPPPITVVDATAIDLPPVTETIAEATHEPTESITRPLAGAHLEYEFAPPPRYSAEMMRAGLEGTVLLRVLVDVDGKPLEVSIERSSGSRELDQLARRQVLGKWRFRPAMQDGQRVQAIGMVPVDFRLNR
jgi:protein TonB